MTVDFESVKIVDYEWIWVELSLYIAAREDEDSVDNKKNSCKFQLCYVQQLLLD